MSIDAATSGARVGIGARGFGDFSARTWIEVKPICDETFEVFIPNWLELQENRGGKKPAKKEQKTDRGKRGEAEPASLPPLALLWNQNTALFRKVVASEAQ